MEGVVEEDDTGVCKGRNEVFGQLFACRKSGKRSSEVREELLTLENREDSKLESSERANGNVGVLMRGSVAVTDLSLLEKVKPASNRGLVVDWNSAELFE